ncbi:MAG: hypothetical protein NTV93_00015 [Verrucomicrobia bacterium]|nr:hypothetical protein [Verrucomicrobiota bacterium]
MKTVLGILFLVALLTLAIVTVKMSMQVSVIGDQIAAYFILTKASLGTNNTEESADAIYHIYSYPQKIELNSTFTHMQKKAQWAFVKLCESHLRDLTGDRTTDSEKLLQSHFSKDVHETLLRRGETIKITVPET